MPNITALEAKGMQFKITVKTKPYYIKVYKSKMSDIKATQDLKKRNAPKINLYIKRRFFRVTCK